MSITEFRDRVRDRLDKVQQDEIGMLKSIAFRPTTETRDGGFLPASTMEEIAVAALNSSTRIRALAQASAILDEEYKKMVDPSPPRGQATEQDGEGWY